MRPYVWSSALLVALGLAAAPAGALHVEVSYAILPGGVSSGGYTVTGGAYSIRYTAAGLNVKLDGPATLMTARQTLTKNGVTTPNGSYGYRKKEIWTLKSPQVAATGTAGSAASLLNTVPASNLRLYLRKCYFPFPTATTCTLPTAPTQTLNIWLRKGSHTAGAGTPVQKAAYASVRTPAAGAIVLQTVNFTGQEVGRRVQTDIPTLSPSGIAVFVSLLMGTSFWLARRGRFARR